MQKLVIALTATTALGLGSAVGVVKATPLTGSIATPSQEFSPIQKIGCERAGENCPYGYRIVKGRGHGWSCEPCWPQHGPKYWRWGEVDYEPRHYRDYDDRYYEPRHYREY
jgi:hypothetical protein